MKVIIESERFNLRLIRRDDHHDVFKGLSNPLVVKHYGVSFTSLEHTIEQMDWFDNLEKTGTGRWFAICSKDTGQFLGAIGYNDLDKINRKAEIGMWLLFEHWGHGTLSEVMPLVLDYGYQKMGLHRIEGFVDSTNVKCKKALDKINFQYEGTMRECEWKNGEFISIDIYASLSKIS